MPRLGLRLAAGARGLDRPIRWVHTSELPDPTPWLSGGEMLLTTGMGLQGSGDVQTAYIDRLVSADLAGLGLGLGFGFEEVPDAVVKAAEKAGFPVLEVPYPVPFIALSEAVLSRLTEERLRDAEMSVEVHERLTKMVSHGSGPSDVVDEVVRLVPGWVLLFDVRGRLLSSSTSPDVSLPDPEKVWADLPPGLTARGGPSTAGMTTPEGTSVALAVTTGAEARPEAVLVFGRGARLEQLDRIVVHHAASVLGLLLASRRAIVEAERRVSGDLLSEALAGRLEGDELERRLELVGFDPNERLTALVLENGDAANVLADELAWAVEAAAGSGGGSVRVGVVDERVVALVDHDDPERLARSLLAEVTDVLGATAGTVRAGVGETVPPREVRRSYLAAVLALRGASHKLVALPADLGSYGFLLGAQRSGALEAFVRSVLGPLQDRDNQRSSHLVASVKAYIEAGGRWEQGAEQLSIHRHTLRYRVRQAEELLQRDLSDAEDRLEVWLALKAAEVLEQ